MEGFPIQHTICEESCAGLDIHLYLIYRQKRSLTLLQIPRTALVTRAKEQIV